MSVATAATARSLRKERSWIYLSSYRGNLVKSLKTHYLLIIQQTALTLDTSYLVYYSIKYY